MNALQVPVSSISEEGVSVRAIVSGAEIRPAGVAELPLGPITVTGILTRRGPEFAFKARIQGHYEGQCDRCLDPVRLPYDLEVSCAYVQGPVRHPIELLAEDVDSGEEPPRAFEGGWIDLSECVWEEIVLFVPLKVLCKPDCEGLCPRCGTNLNRSRCDCAGVVSDERFTSKGLKGLSDILPKLKPKSSEDS